jgi:CelD/BcsL family acetyltransferase involved in cellulose biosynthesis
MHVIRTAIADPTLRVLDFGPGRSDYKRHFSNESYRERNLVLYAPTFRAQRARVVRTAIAATTLGTRRILDAAGVTQRVKTAWRRRLRQ